MYGNLNTNKNLGDFLLILIKNLGCGTKTMISSYE